VQKKDFFGYLEGNDPEILRLPAKKAAVHLDGGLSITSES